MERLNYAGGVPVKHPENFFTRTRHARKIMVLDLGFLGDTVHLLPALWCVRQSYPQAELHVAVAAHITSFMDCAPWVDRVWGYMRYPRHATLRENWEMIARLRREKFDVLINLNGSDRSSWLTFLSGARERLGRVPDDGGPWFWRKMFTAHIECPKTSEPIYVQKCRYLVQAGLPFLPPEFHVEIAPQHLRAAGISETDAGAYFHVSPSTTADRRELSSAQLAELLAGLAKNFPDKKIVLSCAPTEREKKKMAELLACLPQKPWRVFTGNLTLPQLAAVIQNSAAHFGGDTGTLHLATLTDAPTVVWFQSNSEQHLREWLPVGGNIRVFIGKSSAASPFLGGISTTELLLAVQSVLAAR